jgi:hypothetical protein
MAPEESLATTDARPKTKQDPLEQEPPKKH